MYRGVPEQFQDLVKQLCEELAPAGAQFAVLRSLSGKSGATVLLVDISRTQAAHSGAKGGRLHGEYVLKLSEARGREASTSARAESGHVHRITSLAPAQAGTRDLDVRICSRLTASATSPMHETA